MEYNVRNQTESTTNFYPDSQLIDAAKALENLLPLSKERYIASAALALRNAKVLAESSEECAKYARTVYSPQHRTGMWKQVQANARRAVAVTEEKGGSHWEEDGLMWIITLWGEAIPVCQA